MKQDSLCLFDCQNQTNVDALNAIRNLQYSSMEIPTMKSVTADTMQEESNYPNTIVQTMPDGTQQTLVRIPLNLVMPCLHCNALMTAIYRRPFEMVCSNCGALQNA